MVTLDFEPFVSCKSDKLTGSAIDIVSQALTQIHVSFTIECLPWTRAIHMVKTGAADGIIIGFKTDERESFGIFPRYPIQYSYYSVFVKKGNEFLFNSAKDLIGKTVGVERGHSVSTEFDTLIRAGSIWVNESSSVEQNLRKLIAGHIDAYVNNHVVTMNAIRNNNLSQSITYLSIPISTPIASYVWFSKAANIKDEAIFIERLNKVLETMWQSGRIDDILN